MAHRLRRLVAAVFCVSFSTIPLATPGIAATAKELAACNFKNGASMEAAIAGCTAHIQSGKWKGSELSPFYTNRGLAYLSTRKPEKAIEDFDKALEYNPKNLTALLNRASAHIALGEYDKAIADTTASIALNKKNTLAYYNRGNAYLSKRELQKAAADFSSAIAIDPKYLPAYNNRALARTELNQLDDALADSNTALKLAKSMPPPVQTTLLGTRAAIYIKKKNYDLALKDLSAAIALLPKIEYLRARMLVYERLGRYGDGLAEAQRAISMEPSNPLLYNSRCFFLAMLGKLDDALADCNKAISMDPTSPLFFDNRGFVYLKQAKFKEAAAEYEIALQKADFAADRPVTPALAGYLYGRGVARLKGGDVLGGTVDMTKAKIANPEMAERFELYLKN